MAPPPDDDRGNRLQATLWIAAGLPVDPREVRSPYLASRFYRGQ